MVNAPKRSHRGKSIDAVDKGQIQAYHVHGYRIATLLRISKSTVGNLIKRSQETSSMMDKPRIGGARKLSLIDERRILNAVRNNRCINAHQIKQELGIQNVHNTTICRTIRRSGEFKSRWAAKKPYITPANRLKRLRWAQHYINMSAHF